MGIQRREKALVCSDMDHLRISWLVVRVCCQRSIRNDRQQWRPDSAVGRKSTCLLKLLSFKGINYISKCRMAINCKEKLSECSLAGTDLPSSHCRGKSAALCQPCQESKKMQQRKVSKQGSFSKIFIQIIHEVGRLITIGKAILVLGQQIKHIHTPSFLVTGQTDVFGFGFTILTWKVPHVHVHVMWYKRINNE